MIRPSSILFAVLLTVNAFGQRDLGVKVNPGGSYISEKGGESTNTSGQFEGYLPMPSGQTGIFYNRHFGGRWLFGVELLFVQIESKHRFSINETDQNSASTGIYLKNNTWQHMSYFGIPLFFGYDINKINISLGFQVNFIVATGEKEKGRTEYNGAVTTWENHYDKIYLDNTDYGIRGGVTYGFSDKFSLEGTWYHGLHNIFPSNDPDWKYRIRQFTVGLRYRIFSFGERTSAALPLGRTCSFIAMAPLSNNIW